MNNAQEESSFSRRPYLGTFHDREAGLELAFTRSRRSSFDASTLGMRPR